LKYDYLIAEESKSMSEDREKHGEKFFDELLKIEFDSISFRTLLMKYYIR